MASKPRVTSAVVATEYFQKHHQRSERERRHRSSESDENEYHKHRSQRDQVPRDDRRFNRGHRRSRRKSENEDDSDRDKHRRGLRSEKMGKVSVFDRLSSGMSRNQQRDERQEQVVEIETDPCDVPRGKRYFEHDDRNADRGRGYGFNRQNNRNPRHVLQRQRSRSPVWKHDRFEDRRERVSDNRIHNRRSTVWKHDKFEEQETMERKKDTRHEEET